VVVRPFASVSKCMAVRENVREARHVHMHTYEKDREGPTHCSTRRKASRGRLQIWRLQACSWLTDHRQREPRFINLGRACDVAAAWVAFSEALKQKIVGDGANQAALTRLQVEPKQRSASPLEVRVRP